MMKCSAAICNNRHTLYFFMGNDDDDDDNDDDDYDDDNDNNNNCDSDDDDDENAFLWYMLYVFTIANAFNVSSRENISLIIMLVILRFVCLFTVLLIILW